jgi:hypothetical protein
MIAQVNQLSEIVFILLLYHSGSLISTVDGVIEVVGDLKFPNGYTIEQVTDNNVTNGKDALYVTQVYNGPVGRQGRGTQDYDPQRHNVIYFLHNEPPGFSGYVAMDKDGHYLRLCSDARGERKLEAVICLLLH